MSGKCSSSAFSYSATYSRAEASHEKSRSIPRRTIARHRGRSAQAARAREIAHVDDVIAATGFTAPLLDLPDLGVATYGQSRLPAQTPYWESATVPGVDLATDLAGIRSPNPFWLASCPITNTGEMVARAFDAGWGGVVWKTLGEDGPPVVNVNGPRYGALLTPDRRLLGFNNIELITDRPLQTNLDEIRTMLLERCPAPFGTVPIYQTAFEFFKMGRAAAMSVFLFAAVMIFTIFQIRLFSRGEE